MKKDEISDLDRLYHIQDAVNFVLINTDGISEDEFYRAEILKRAVVRDMEVIGEAANFISKELKDKYPSVQWRQIIATRHQIIHEYFHLATLRFGILSKTICPN